MMPVLILFATFIILLISTIIQSRFRTEDILLTGCLVTIGLQLLLGTTFDLVASSQFIACVATIIILLMISESQGFNRSMCVRSMMLCASLTGVCGLIAADSFLSIYAALELMSIPMVILLCIDKNDTNSHIAAWRYFILTVCGSALWLLGMVLLFGLTGEGSLTAATKVIAQGLFPLISTNQSYGWVLLTMVLLLAGFTIKLGLVPMQRWVIDVYMHVPFMSLIWFSTIPKLAMWTLMIKTLMVFTPYRYEILILCLPLACISIFYGSFMAVAQKTVRGLLAYSSIAQMGFVVIGCALSTQQAFVAGTFFLCVYMLISILVLGILLTVKRDQSEIVYWQELNGLFEQCPQVSWMLLIAIFTMAGVPPMIGFVSKFSIIRVLMQEHLWPIALAVMVVSVVAAFYYIRIISVAFFKLPVYQSANMQYVFSYVSIKNRVILIILSVCTMLFGLFPGMLLDFIERWLT